jgi:hypothetical protein
VATKRADLDFFIGDYKNGQIINHVGDHISANSPEFNDYACLNKEKVKGLKALLYY